MLVTVSRLYLHFLRRDLYYFFVWWSIESVRFSLFESFYDQKTCITVNVVESYTLTRCAHSPESIRTPAALLHDAFFDLAPPFVA